MCICSAQRVLQTNAVASLQAASQLSQDTALIPKVVLKTKCEKDPLLKWDTSALISNFLVFSCLTKFIWDGVLIF